MGTDIYGFIEIRDVYWKAGYWEGAARLHAFSTRNYGVFRYLFGVRLPSDWEGAEPLASERGIPDDVSNEFRAEYDYKPEEDNTSWLLHSSWLTYREIRGTDWNQELGALDISPNQGRRPGPWMTIFKLMETLAEGFGDNNVRLVVFFDGD